jgi:hypothetical protein
MDRSNKNIKRENELLDAIKSLNICAVQRILSKCRSGKSSKCRDEDISLSNQSNSLDIISPKKINLNFQDNNG